MDTVIGGGLVALVSGIVLLTSEHRKHSQAVREARRNGYSRYLAAQQALHMSIRDEIGIAITYEAVEGTLPPDHTSRKHDLYVESSTAEMDARLLADSDVCNAIDVFEQYVNNAMSAAKGEKGDGGPSFAIREWIEQRDKLIDAMVRENRPRVRFWAK